MRYLVFACALLAALTGVASAETPRRPRFDFEWNLVTGDAPWGGRAGLQAVRLGLDIYVLGGRTPRPPSFPPIPGDSQIWGDVWRSGDEGRTWTRVLETNDQDHWPARAYFQAVSLRGSMYVLGGQNFRVFPNPGCPDPSLGCPPVISASDFFDDVWRSRDGSHWQRLTDAPGWDGRAGLSAVAFRGQIYVLGGSRNDDSSIIGGPPQRIYYNDVWRSCDGVRWERITEHAPWSPRAGAAVTVKDGYLYVLGGEAGFLCAPQPCQLPYFNDVWRTRDGVRWELVTAAADWSPRPGHQCVTFGNRIVCFGGFGIPVNPIDMWSSRDGAHWEPLQDSPWSAVSPDQGKYDFDALAVQGVPGFRSPAIFTFGGDRETFDFTDPLNYLRVDDEVWRYSLRWPMNRPDFAVADGDGEESEVAHAITPVSTLAHTMMLATSGPNPTAGSTSLRFSIPAAGDVSLGIYDLSGRLVRELVSGHAEAGTQEHSWDARDAAGHRAPSGIYFAKLITRTENRSTRIVLLP